MAIEDFGTERDDIEPIKFKKYKGKKGNEDRVGIIFPDDNKKKMFKGAPCHYKDRYFLCKSTKGNKEICCTHGYDGNTPKYHIGAVLVIYDMVTQEGKPKLRGFETIPWVFSETMYQKRKSADQEFELDTHDIKLKCTNEEYQTIDVTICKESIWRSGDKIKKKVLEEAESHFENLGKQIASDLGITEIRELLGIDAPGVDDAATDVDLENVIDTI